MLTGPKTLAEDFRLQAIGQGVLQWLTGNSACGEVLQSLVIAA